MPISQIRDQFNDLPTWAKIGIGIGSAVLVTGSAVHLFGKGARKSPIKDDWKTGTVYLYQFQRAKVIPSISPYCLKLETWLRMKNITYENIDAGWKTKSKEGMLPFVELNGKEYYDSGLIIDDLSKIFKAVDSNLTGEQTGATRAFEQMMENMTFWPHAAIRYVDHFDTLISEKVLGFKLPLMFRLPIWRYLLSNSMKKRLYAHGIGRHSKEDMIKIGNDDLRAISQYLGQKQFLMGDEPTRVDACIFAFLAQMLYIPIPSPQKQLLDTELINLKQYCERVKQRFWPDWEELCRTRSLSSKPRKA